MKSTIGGRARRCLATAVPAWCEHENPEETPSGLTSSVCRQRAGGKQRRINPQMKVGCMLAMVAPVSRYSCKPEDVMFARRGRCVNATSLPMCSCAAITVYVLNGA